MQLAASPATVDLVESAGTASSSGYRRDIDGLRGIAVLAVIGFHVFPDWVRGGYVGVDVFFVISGYLISTIILTGLQRGRFSFARFYARRVKRIFPALAVVLAACAVWGWFYLFPSDYEQFGRHMAGSAGFVANFVLMRDVWYFEPASAQKPLLHLWSLGIEEQFYLVWPLILWAAWRRRWNPLWPTVVILVASFALNAFVIRRDAAVAFYSPLTRAWELGIGAALACATTQGAQWTGWLSGRGRHVVSTMGVAFIALALFAFGENRVLGLRAVLPTAGAALMIAAGPLGLFNAVLSSASLVRIGLISYPLYLWHWPLLSAAGIVRLESPPALGVRMLVVVASVLLAWMTYRLIERPIRFGPPRASIVPLLCSILAAILCAGVVTNAMDGLPGRHLQLSDRARFIYYYDSLRVHGLAKAYWDGCDLLDWDTRRTKSAIDTACTRPGARGTVLLWGDSYAQALSLGLRQLVPSGIGLAQVTTSGCSPTDLAGLDDRCARSHALALAAIRELKPIAVVLAQSGGHESTDWNSLAREIRTLGAGRVLLMGPSPKWRPSLPRVVASDYWGRDYGRVKAGLDQAVFKTDAVLKSRYSDRSVLDYVSIVDRLCSVDGCLAAVPGGGQDLIAVDTGHLSPRGSVFVVNRVLSADMFDR